MADKITWNDKVTLINDETIPDENKVTAADMNQIKQVVNNNSDETGSNTAKIATLQLESGNTIELSLNNTTYVLTATLKNASGTVLNTSSVDFPVEQLILDITYDSETKELIITLKNGQTRRIPLEDLIDGLVNETDFNELELTVQSLQSELIQTKKDLNNSTLTISGQGEDITLNNTVEASFKKAPLPEGNSKQNTNLSDGILEQGSLSEGSPVSANDRIRTTNYIEVKEGTEIPVNATSSKTIQVLYAFYDNSKTFLSNSGWNNLATNVAIINTAKYIKVVIKNSDGTNISPNDVSNFIVGNIPNPEYEQAIYSVGDDINEFDKDNTTIEMGSINTSGALIASTTRARAYNITIEPNKTYTISSSNSNLNIVPYYYNEDNTFISYDNGWKTLPFTFTAPNNAKILKVLFKNAITDTITLDEITKIKLQKGTKANPYSPYGMGTTTEKIVNKNLFDKDNANILNAFVNTNTRVINANSSARSVYIEIKPNTTYTISKIASQRFAVGSSTSYEFNTTCTVEVHNQSGSVLTITTGANDKYLIVFYYLGTADTLTEQEIRNSIQIEENSTATPYTEHQEQTYIIPTQQPMRSIGNVRDGFVKVNGSWVERHYISRKVFDGTENWITPTQVAYSLSKATDFPNNNMSAYSTDTYLCSHFSIVAYQTSYTGKVWVGGSNINFNYDNSRSNLEDFKSWLAEQYANGTPVYTDYLLGTPLDLPCTSEQIAILNEIEKYSESYQDVTHIFSTDEVSPYFEVEARGDINSLLTRIEVLESEV